MRYTLAFAAVLVLATPAPAESMLLAEVTWNQPIEAFVPSRYALSTEIDIFMLRAGWSEDISQFPRQSWASDEVVEGFNRTLTWYNQPAGIVPLNTWDYLSFPVVKQPGTTPFITDDRGVRGCGSCFSERLIGDERDIFLHNGKTYYQMAVEAGWNATRYVPIKGESLFGYNLTDVERYVTAQGQMIRFYGVAVREPASWLLACFGLCFIRNTAPGDFRTRNRYSLVCPATPESTNHEAWPASLFERNCPAK